MYIVNRLSLLLPLLIPVNVLLCYDTDNKIFLLNNFNIDFPIFKEVYNSSCYFCSFLSIIFGMTDMITPPKKC